MSFSLTGLTNYVNQNTLPLMTKAVFGAKSIAMANKMVGLKSTSAINIMDTTASFAYGVSCAFSNNGTTTFSQRNIAVKHLKVHESLCPQALEQTWLQHHLPQGSLYQAIPFEEAYANQKVAMIGRQLESISWVGDSTSIDGWKDAIDAVTGGTEGVTDPINANATAYTGNGSAITKAQFVANAAGTTSRRTVLQAIERAIPTDILGSDDVVVFCGWDVFRTLIGALKANTGVMYNQVDLQGLADGDIIYPGTNVRVVAVPGLLGYNRLVCSYLGNFFYGTDLLSDEENFELWYSKDNDEVRFQAAFKVGFQVAYPDLVVDWRLA